MLRQASRLLMAMAIVSPSTHAAPPDGPAAMRLPVERDCLRWEAPRGSVFDRGDERDGPTVGAFADRAPNVDTTLRTTMRRPTSIDVLLCEQLNVKDKLDVLIRRTLR